MLGTAYRRWCSKCRYRHERAALCSQCGATRTGSHPSYCRECYRQYAADWAKRNPEKVAEKMWRHDLKRTYNLSVEQWHELYDKQGGRCAICGAAEPAGRGRFHIDHSHACCDSARSCGKCVRGLLCSRCNVALGMINDDPTRLRAAADYVELHDARIAAASPQHAAT